MPGSARAPRGLRLWVAAGADAEMRRPRLALVAHGVHDRGGMERSFAELVFRLHERYEIVVIAADLGEPLQPLVEWQRIRVPARPAPLRFTLFWLLAAARIRTESNALVHTLGAIVPNRIDLVTVPYCHAGFRAATGRLAPAEAPPLRRLNTGLTRLVGIAAERLTFRSSRVRVAAPVSHGLARELGRHYPGLALEVIPNGVDSSRFRPDEDRRREMRKALAIGTDDVVAIFVGGDWDRKGLTFAIEGIARARASTGLPIRLIVVGEGDEERFRTLAQELGVRDAVVFSGWRSDTERHYAAADLFVFPSSYEAFPLVALEAAAAGLPIVAPLINGIEELIADGEAGVPVERTSESVGDAIATLASDPELRRRLGARARERVGELTWDRWAESHEAIYRSLLGGASTRAVPNV